MSAMQVATIVGLWIATLLPIIRNTYTAIRNVDPALVHLLQPDPDPGADDRLQQGEVLQQGHGALGLDFGLGNAPRDDFRGENARLEGHLFDGE